MRRKHRRGAPTVGEAIYEINVGDGWKPAKPEHADSVCTSWDNTTLSWCAPTDEAPKRRKGCTKWKKAPIGQCCLAIPACEYGEYVFVINSGGAMYYCRTKRK